MVAKWQKCWACEGSGIQSSLLYLIPFWPRMVCRRCNGSGCGGISLDELHRVHYEAAAVLRRCTNGEQHFHDCLIGKDAEGIRESLVKLEEAYRWD